MFDKEKMMYIWKRFGGYEVSSKGDKRFSAFNARMTDGRSLEQHYQCDVKGYDMGGTNWQLGKGKPPLDRSKDMWTEYLALWKTWVKDNMPLVLELKQKVDEHGGVLSDRFATTSVNQAHALACVLNEL